MMILGPIIKTEFTNFPNKQNLIIDHHFNGKNYALRSYSRNDYSPVLYNVRFYRDSTTVINKCVVIIITFLFSFFPSLILVPFKILDFFFA